MKFSLWIFCRLMFKEITLWVKPSLSFSVAWSYSKQLSTSSNPVSLLLHWLQCRGIFFKFEHFLYLSQTHTHCTLTPTLFFFLNLSPANSIFFCDIPGLLYLYLHHNSEKKLFYYSVFFVFLNEGAKRQSWFPFGVCRQTSSWPCLCEAE